MATYTVSTCLAASLLLSVSGYQDRGALQGRVFDARSGRAVPNATVQLNSDFIASSVEVETGPDGGFILSNLPPGLYSVNVLHPIYLTNHYVQNGAVQERATARVDGLRMASIELGLLKGGVITGTVLDSAGLPAYGAKMTVEQIKSGAQGRGTVEQVDAEIFPVNDAGEYRISRLPPGRYVVGAASPDLGESKGHLSATWYPGVTQRAGAQWIELSYSQEFSGANFSIQAGASYDVMGEVVGANGSPVPDGTVRLIETAVSGQFSAEVHTARIRAGSFRLSNISPGTYQLLAQRREGNGAFAEVNRIVVTVYNDNSRVFLTLRRVPRIHGKLTGIFSQGQAKVIATPVGSDSFASSPVELAVSANGEFSGGVPPGKWRLSVIGLGSYGAIRRLLQDGQEVFGDLHIGNASEVRILIEIDPFATKRVPAMGRPSNNRR